MQSSTINRRKFFQLSGITGTGFLLGLSKSGIAGVAVSRFENIDNAYSFTPFINIEKSGKITIFNPRPEMGQGTFQSVPSLIAEELELSLDQVTIRLTDGQKIFGASQWAGGSFSVRGSYTEFRKIGASAKEMLVKAGAETWSVPVEECYAEQGKVLHRPTGKSVSYAELAEKASKLSVPKEPKLKDPKDFILLGKATARPDVPLKSSGKAIFGIDAEAPGMVYASVERCPVFGGKMVSFDDTATKKVTGVLGVYTCDRIFGTYKYQGVGVVATNYWAALQGRKALKVKWDGGANATFNSKDYEQLMRNVSKKDGMADKPVGDFDKTFASAPVKLEAFYETPFVSHSPIEPMNCLANWHDNNKVDIWASTQVPGGLVDEISKYYDIPPENLKLTTSFIGGGFGRRLINDFVYEAVDLSKKTGKPVKVIWTREDDTKQGPFRPPTFSALKAGLGSDGKPIAFQHKVMSPSIDASMEKNYDRTKMDGTMVEGISEQKYEIPNMKNAFILVDCGIPVFAWRAVTSTTLAFSHESFIDEMAVKAMKDPLQYRLDMMTKDSDAKNVLLKLKEVSGWDKPLPAGWGRGVAQYEFFAGLSGNVVVVSKQGKGIKIEKIYSVIDMGTVVNPDTVKGQVEGAVVMALTAAIKGGITFNNGGTVQSNFNDNPILRINEIPEVEVHILANGGPVIKGAGEPGVPPFAPALTNAIFAATGKRIRKLPFDIKNIV